jgi:hypothetical protein
MAKRKVHNLAVIDTYNHEYKVYNGTKLIADNQFNTSLEPEQVQAYRENPKAFLASLAVDIDEEFPNE